MELWMTNIEIWVVDLKYSYFYRLKYYNEKRFVCGQKWFFYWSHTTRSLSFGRNLWSWRTEATILFPLRVAYFRDPVIVDKWQNSLSGVQSVLSVPIGTGVVVTAGRNFIRGILHLSPCFFLFDYSGLITRYNSRTGEHKLICSTIPINILFRPKRDFRQANVAAI